MTILSKENLEYVSSSYDVSEQRFCDDLYLLDYIEDFRAIAYRHSRGRLALGESFLSLLGERERTALLEYLYDERDDALVLSTSRGSAVIDKRLTPSVQLVVASFLCSEKSCGTLAEMLARRGERGFVTLSEYAEGSRVRFPASFAGDLRRTRSLLGECFATEHMPIIRSADGAVRNFERSVESAARLCGCDVSLDCASDVKTDERFDFYAFEGFIIAMLLLARRISPERRAHVTVENCFDGVSVTVNIGTAQETNVFALPEIYTFYEFAGRQNMLFEASCAAGGIRVRFAPSRKDWSYLELKKPLDLDWRR